MTKNYRITHFEKIKDSRGSLIVFLKESEIKHAKKKFGQIYFVTFSKRGAVRGNHYHKKWYEWFGIVDGKVEVVLVNVKTKEQKRLILDAKKDKYVRLETGPYVAHAIKSLTKYASLLSYADSEWHTTDTYKYKIL